MASQDAFGARRRSEVLDRLSRAAAHLLRVPRSFVALDGDGVPWLAGCSSEAASPDVSCPSLPAPVERLWEDVVRDGAERVHASASDEPPAFVGVPIRGPEGTVRGALCAVDTSPRAWSARELDGLRDLAAAAASELERHDVVQRLREREERLAFALDGTGEGLWDWDVPSGRVFFSPSWMAMLGYTADELRPHVSSWESLVHPDDWPVIRAALTPHLQGTSPKYACEHRIRHRDGSWRWILDRGRVVQRDAAGAAVRVVGTHTDITARREVLDALRLSEERYALAARASNTAVWEWDIDADAVQWSEGIGTLFGYSADTVSQEPDWWIQRVHPDDRLRVLATLRAAIDEVGDDREWTETYRFRRADGTWAVVIDRGYRILDAERRPARMVGAMEDVTSRTLLEERLRQSQKIEAVGQLAGGVAHDFNNLLTAMSGNLELAEMHLAPDIGPGHPARENLAAIGSAVDRAATLVRQLLAFGRKQPVRPTTLCLGDLVRGAEQLLRRVIGEEIALEVRVPDTEPATRADRGQIEQVLLNLAVNARDAMLTARHGHPGGGGTLTITTGHVHLTEAQAAPWEGLAARDYASLVVRDTGHGMDDGVRSHIFEPFFTTKAVGQGTGLGLAMAFGIVRQAGGGIMVESEPGAGTTFTVLLPTVEAVAEAPPAAAEPEPSAHGGTILLVEDEEPVRAALRQLLLRRGYRVLAAAHGEEALAHWARERDRVTAVVTDVRMPAMGGPELMRRLRADRPDLPVVYISGYADGAKELLRSPRERFMEKPFSAGELVRVLEELLQEAPARRAGA